MKIFASYLSVATCSIIVLFSTNSLMKWWLTISYVFNLWIRRKDKSKKNHQHKLKQLWYPIHSLSFIDFFQSKKFVKLSYHALGAYFNISLSLVFLPISVSVAKDLQSLSQLLQHLILTVLQHRVKHCHFVLEVLPFL